MLKYAGDGLVSCIAELFTEILKPHLDVPDAWRRTRLNVLFKKGDPQALENYRPISILPILLKLFSRVLYARIERSLTSAQSVDQAGFRADYASI